MKRHLAVSVAAGVLAALTGLVSCAVHAQSLPSEAACIAPGVPTEYYAAVVEQESGKNPLALHDDATNTPYYPATLEDAERIARGLLAQGHSVGIGLGQLTSRSEPAFEAKFGLTVHEALANPCANMRAGSALLQRGLMAALSTYNCGGPNCAPRYVRQVLARVPGVGKLPAIVTPSAAAIPPKPPACAPSWDPWALASCSARIRHATTSPQPQPTNTETASR